MLAVLAALVAHLQDPTPPEPPPAPAPVTAATLGTAGRVVGLEFTDDELELMVRGARQNLRSFEALRERPLDNAVPPALTFAPLGELPAAVPTPPMPLPDVARPEALEDVSFWSIRELAALVKSRQVSCVELVELFLARLERFDPQLHCVITLTSERARERARALDAMLARGEWLGPLHGIPFGAKDLLSARGYRTTWGAKPFEDQVIDADAAVIRTLEERGAVLVAKLSLGALAWGDVWFRGRTRNPWNPEQGSSGSSAGSAAATAAGAVPFAIGSETLGSIVSPAAQCGCTGLRPTHGVVDTRGAMVLSWSMDKLGPLCRSAEDAAIVLAAMLGRGSASGFEFRPAVAPDVTGMRLGYLASAFEGRRADPTVLDELRALGCELVPIELPEFPVRSLTFVLNAEAAAAFDAITRDGRDELMVRQAERAWPNVFRVSRLIPAVEYLQAQRVRTLLMRAMQAMFDDAAIDAYVHPTHGNASLAATNLTGHPSIVAPRAWREDGTPRSVSFTGRVYGEARLLAIVQAWQAATGYHEARQPKVGGRSTGDGTGPESGTGR